MNRTRQPFETLNLNQSLDISQKRHHKGSSLPSARALRPHWNSDLSSAATAAQDYDTSYKNILVNEHNLKSISIENNHDEELEEDSQVSGDEQQQEQAAGVVREEGGDDASLLQNTGDHGSSQDAAAQQQQQQPMPPALTDTINQGLLAMHQRREGLIDKAGFK
jgi:hypothetical protein